MTGPKVRLEDARGLYRILDKAIGFLKAREIVELSTFDSRMIRAICSDKPSIFLSTQAGYRLVKYSEDSEIENAIADLRSRILHLSQRAQALEKALNDRHQSKLELEPAAPAISGEDRDKWLAGFTGKDPGPGN